MQGDLVSRQNVWNISTANWFVIVVVDGCDVTLQVAWVSKFKKRGTASSVSYYSVIAFVKWYFQKTMGSQVISSCSGQLLTWDVRRKCGISLANTTNGNQFVCARHDSVCYGCQSLNTLELTLLWSACRWYPRSRWGIAFWVFSLTICKKAYMVVGKFLLITREDEHTECFHLCHS